MVAKICEKTEVPAGETMETLKAKYDEKLALLKKVSSHAAPYPESVGIVQWSSGMEDRICGGLSKAIEKTVSRKFTTSLRNAKSPAGHPNHGLSCRALRPVLCFGSYALFYDFYF